MMDFFYTTSSVSGIERKVAFRCSDVAWVEKDGAGCGVVLNSNHVLHISESFESVMDRLERCQFKVGRSSAEVEAARFGIEHLFVSEGGDTDGQG